MRGTGSPGGPDGGDAAHDVLAAEEFGMPVADPTIHPRPVVLPDDPTGIQEPHDVLAAEEFAMPAVRPHGGELGPRGVWRSRPWLIAGTAMLVLRRVRRRRRG
jgi:hypothetical protein